MFLAVNGSVCPTNCKAPEGPVCLAACQYDDLAKMFNTYIEGQQVGSLRFKNCYCLQVWVANVVI